MAFTIIELYNTEEDSVNHHGFERKVDNVKNEQKVTSLINSTFIDDENFQARFLDPYKIAKGFGKYKFALLWGEAQLCLPYVC